MSNFECVICYNFRAVSVRAPCKHEFCVTCICRTLAESSERCPLCRAALPNSFNEYKVTFFSNLNGISVEDLQLDLPIVCREGTLEQVKEYFNYGVDVNGIGFRDSFPLYYASGRDDLEISKFLLNENADVNQVGYLGRTALIMASTRGKFPTVDDLIQHGANINHADELHD